LTLRNTLFGIISALAFLAAANSASSASLTLRTNINIIDDIVTLGDLFEHAGNVANKAVFRSPRLGQTGILKARRIKQAAREHGLVWLNPKYLDNIVITRKANKISLEEIRNRISEELSNNYPRRVSQSQLEITLSNKAAPLVMRADFEADFEIRKINYEQRSGRFSALISGPVGSPDAKRILYKGRATEVMEIPVLIQTLARGETITISHLETKKFPARRINNRTVTEAADLIGMALRRTLRPNTLIRTNDVEEPKLVKKNTSVSVVYKFKALQITFRGRALEDGAYGQAISVLNPRSRRIIQAIVTAPNLVTAQGGNLRKTASLSQ